MKQATKRPTGFTLIEMLVVFGVFALMGVIASQIVSRVLHNQQVLSERGMRLAEVQRMPQYSTALGRRVDRSEPAPRELPDRTVPRRLG